MNCASATECITGNTGTRRSAPHCLSPREISQTRADRRRALRLPACDDHHPAGTRLPESVAVFGKSLIIREMLINYRRFLPIVFKQVIVNQRVDLCGDFQDRVQNPVFTIVTAITGFYGKGLLLWRGPFPAKPHSTALRANMHGKDPATEKRPFPVP